MRGAKSSHKQAGARTIIQGTRVRSKEPDTASPAHPTPCSAVPCRCCCYKHHLLERGRERERERVARIARILDAHLWTRAGGEPRALFARKIRLKQRNQYQHLRGGKRGGEGGVPGSLSRHIQWEIRCEAVFSALFYWCEPARPFYGLSLFAGDRVAENKYVPAGGV